MKTLKEYINLLEGDVTPGLQSVGVSEPEESNPVDVDVTFSTNITTGEPERNVKVFAGGRYSPNTKPDELRSALNDAGIDLPDEPNAKPNTSGISVSVSNDTGIYASANGEAGDELLSILKNAGLYKGTDNA